MSSHPRVLVLGGNLGRWKASDLEHDRATINGIEAWVFAFDGEYINGLEATPEDIARFDIVIGNTNTTYLNHYAKLSANRPSRTKWVSLIEGDAIQYSRPMPGLQATLDNSDLVNVINTHSLPLFGALTKTKVAEVGIPYPAESVRGFMVPKDKRKREAFICSRLGSRVNDYLVAKNLSIGYFGYERRVSRTWQNARTLWKLRTADARVYQKKAAAYYSDPNLEIRQETSIAEYYPKNANALLWVNLDDRFTWARFVLDAATLGIPIITTESTAHGPRLFPETTVRSALDVQQAIEIGRRLISDDAFYQRVSDYPQGMLDHLRPERIRERLLEVLG
jgi:hypothetical protein